MTQMTKKYAVATAAAAVSSILYTTDTKLLHHCDGWLTVVRAGKHDEEDEDTSVA